MKTHTLSLVLNDNKLFPLNLNYPTFSDAKQGLAWQRIGAGARDEHRILALTELKAEMKKGNVSLDIFTKEAQERKTRFIMSEGKAGGS